MSRVVDVAKGVVALLTAGVAADAFSYAFTPSLCFDANVPLTTLESDSEARCDVIPSRAPFELTSRSSCAYRCGIDICLRARLKYPSVDSDGTIDPDEFGVWPGVLEQINEYLAYPSRRRLSSTYQSGVWSESEIAMLWAPNEHRDLRQYTGIMRVTYVVDVEQ